MKYWTILTVVTVSFCLAAADYSTQGTADREFLLKQKTVYELLYYTSYNLTLCNEGVNFDMEASIDSYRDPNVVRDFLYMYTHGTLPRGEVYSMYYPKMRQEMEALFYLFYYAKDFDTFCQTASWARIHMNEMQYVHALYTAVIFRNDTMYIQLPAPYEMFPYEFFNTEVLAKAHHPEFFGKHDSRKTDGNNTYIIPANYSGWYMLHDDDHEYMLNYFTEDVGLNAYYFYFREQYPFWLKTNYSTFKKYRGEEYLYGHKQLLARYNLERLSNDMGKMENFDWHREFHNGYYPTMTFPNGLPSPQRPHQSKFPHYKFKYMKEMRHMESRITGVIDSGYISDTTDRKMAIYNTREGLNMLGNIIEGNMDSCNYNYYGSMDTLARKILGYNLKPMTPYQTIPSALEMHTTSMRDPAFYSFYKRICTSYYYRYKMHEQPYNESVLVHPNLKIESFMTDKLMTYFDKFYTTISYGMMVGSTQETKNMLIKVRQHRLNHKPYRFNITINADKNVKAAIRIFMGPKYDVHHKQMDFVNSFKYFYEMDKWMVELKAGVNNIVRNCMNASYVIPDPEPSEVFYKKVIDALKNNKTLTHPEKIYGFPERLLLPKGKKEGMPFQIFVYVNPVVEEHFYMSRVFGNTTFDNNPFGFPLDKPTVNFHYNGTNMMLKDVMVYHKDENEMNITY